MSGQWQLLSYVLRGPNRGKVLKALGSPRTPTQLAKELKIDRPSVSRALLELQREGLVECLTPSVKRGRLYRRTPQGNRVNKRF